VTARATAATEIQIAPLDPTACAAVVTAAPSRFAVGAPEATRKTTAKVANSVGTTPTDCSLDPKSLTVSTME
jgi:hypothetical protein